MLNSHGDAWSVGANDVGQLGNGTFDNSTVIANVLMPTEVRFASVVAASNRFIAIPANTSDTNLYGWGVNGSLQHLLLEPTVTNMHTPTAMPMGRANPQAVTGLSESTYFQYDAGNAIFWGKNSVGSSGMNNESASYTSPTSFINEGFLYLHGLDSTYAAIDQERHLMNWGAGYNGQMGRGNYNNSLVPVASILLVLKIGEHTVQSQSALNMGGGEYRITVPTHAAGTVNVEIFSYTLFGVSMTVPENERLIGTWTYVDPSRLEVVAHPQEQSVFAGEVATFVVDHSGFPFPTVAWQMSNDEGQTWVTTSESDQEAIDSSDNRVLRVTAPLTHDGRKYRAVFTNIDGSVSTDSATLFVSEKGEVVVLQTPQVADGTCSVHPKILFEEQDNVSYSVPERIRDGDTVTVLATPGSGFELHETPGRELTENGTATYVVLMNEVDCGSNTNDPNQKSEIRNQS